MQSGSSTDFRTLTVLAAIVLAGLLLRLPGQLYPATLHYDEGAEVSSVLCEFPPGGALYHPFLSRYLLGIPENLLCVATKLRGSEHAYTETRANFQLDPMPYVHIGRAIALFFGLAAIVVIFLLGRSVGGTGTGLAAALFVAVSPVHIMVSNNLRPWALASLLTAAVLFYLKDVVRPETQRRALVIVGALGGLTVATVYVLAIVAVPIFVALLARWHAKRAKGLPTQWLQDIAVTAAAAIVAHVLANFTGLLSLGGTMQEAGQPTASMMSSTAGGVENSQTLSYLTNVKWYFQALLDPLGLGAVLAVTGLVGLVVAALRREPVWLAMTALVAIVLIVQPLAVVLMANRYTIPAVPALVVAAGWLIMQVTRMAKEKWPAIARVRPEVLLTLLVALPGVLVTLEYHRALALTPTRVLAREWIEKQLPAGPRIVQNIPYISPVIADCQVVAQSQLQHFAHPCYDVSFTPGDDPRVVVDFLEKSDAAYLVYTAATPIGTMLRLGTTDAVPALRKRFQLVARFHHPDLDQFHDDTATVNPPVEIYRLAPAGSPPG